MKTQITFIVAGLMTAIVLAGAESARAATWTQKADMPTARMRPDTSVVNGKIYAISALHNSDKQIVEAYDPATDTWTAKADMPTPRVIPVTGVVNGKIYVIGGATTWPGGTALATVEEYDPMTDTWTRKAGMPTRRRRAAASVVDGKIYVIGGGDGSDGAQVSTVEAYDPVTDTWTRKADMPSAREFLTTSVVDGKIYAIGGQVEYQVPNATFSAVEVYDPAIDTWTRKADIPLPRVGHTAGVLNNMIYIFGGRSTPVTGTPTSAVFAYDPAADTWTSREDMPYVVGSTAASAVDRRIYLVGGSSVTYPFSPVLSTVWEFIPAPEFDFNGDSVVDAQDMSILVDHWHTDAARYDLAPAPVGDGIVDAQDLVALSEHLFEDDRLLALWLLDETEGDIAYDSAAENDGSVLGSPVWQPEGGQVGGALEFDGIDDVIIAGSVLNPEDGPFSVFAWVKGVAPDQAIISQQGGANWLQADVNGALMTELTKNGGRRPGVPLYSETVITDDNWHRVGFVWDGTDRILYVDDIEVARDTFGAVDIDSADGGLRIGAGKDPAVGSFWSGMIDDVRIYNQAVAP
jgi:N-acetylneuraminic acid mutarotase